MFRVKDTTAATVQHWTGHVFHESKLIYLTPKTSAEFIQKSSLVRAVDVVCNWYVLAGNIHICEAHTQKMQKLIRQDASVS